MSALFALPLAIVDLETTGADPHRDRITEIAILRVEQGLLVQRWSALLDPEIPIPPRIQAFTGISDAMVAGAPNFRALADEIAQRLAGAVFVAHNARFDFSFLRAAFAARGMPFDPAVMCSVKFSRALNPEHARHGLDAIIARQGYVVEDRHRALTDAELVWRFLQDSLQAHSEEKIAQAFKRASSRAAEVPCLPAGDLEALPEAPGVYVLLNGAGGVLQIGHTPHLRSKVLGLFTARNDARSARLAQATRRVETAVAAGDLDAQLQELALSRAFQAQKHPGGVTAWAYLGEAGAGPVLAAQAVEGEDPQHWQHRYGLFRGPREAENALRELALLHRLCHRRIGLEHGTGPCQAHGLRRCNGVCTGAETPAEHDKRLLAALLPLRLRPWPWPGAVALSEYHEASGRFALHVFDTWCHLGSARDEAAAADLLAALPPRRFDYEAYRVFLRWLTQPGHASALRPLPVA